MTGLLCRTDLEALDRADPLRAFRERFALPDGVIYLDGNSLGAAPRATAARLATLIEQEWGDGLVRSWNTHHWADLAQRVGEKIGKLIGAQPGETLVADSTSVNLFKLLAMALRLRPQRRVILSESDNFPTDLYIAQGLSELLGGRHELRLVPPGKMPEAITDEVAVVLLSHVSYRSGQMHDLARVTAQAHAAGALTLWDLAHSAGAMPIDLTQANADFAVGCGYKYLNGGPGAPAFLYIARRLQDQVRSPIAGWFGHAQPFEFTPDYAPAPGITRAAAGTPPILSLAALEVGVDLLLNAPMQALRAKSLRQGELLVTLIEQELSGAFDLVSPRDPARRGSQVCLRHQQAWPICQALIDRGVIGDFRTPDILRLGFTPLYLGYAELWDAVAILKDIMQNDTWKQARFQQRKKVT